MRVRVLQKLAPFPLFVLHLVRWMRRSEPCEPIGVIRDTPTLIILETLTKLGPLVAIDWMGILR